ncbi:uncharacterized protein LOC106676089 [Maylandia zebra]|uniref:uncharacterized protein LOC106676089 n=1 Tax=Maylandia zebra TaxID=106582 RepID=UPI00403D0426
MKVNIFCCLLACTLGSNVAAGLTHEGVKEGTQVTLRCPHSVEGGVRWSRESGGSRADILTADGDKTTKHINDPQKRYSSQADGVLIVLRAAPSDSGRYFCDHEAAVELTVIPSDHETSAAATTTTVTHQPAVTSAPSASRHLFDLGIRALVVFVCSLVLVIIYFIWRQKSKRRGTDKQLHVCDETPAGAELHLINGAAPASTC